MQNPLDDLIGIFNNISTYQNTKNNLILDHDISNQLNYLTDNHFSEFSTSSNIDHIFWFDNNDLLHDQLNSLLIDNGNNNDPISIVFLFNLKSAENFKKLVDFSSFIKEKFIVLNSKKDFNIHLITSQPSLNKSIEKFLSISGVLGDLSSVHVWDSLLFFELCENVYSLELDNDAGFKNLFLNDSTIPLELIAKSLLNLYISSNYKLRITNIYLKGLKSIKFWSIFKRLLNSHLQSLSDYQRKIIDDTDEAIFMDLHSFYNNSVDLICLDRSNDLLSLLLTQLTYSGLCNEFLVKNSQLELVEFINDNENDVENDSNLIKFKLDDTNDKIYPLIKYLNFSHVGKILNQKAKLLQFEFDKRKNLHDLNEMKTFVNELNNLKNSQSWVQKHTSLAEFVIKNFNNNKFNFKTGIDLLDDIDPNDNTESYFTQIVELQQDILSNQINISQIFSKISYLLNLFNPPLEDIIKLIILTSIVKKGLKESEFQSLNSQIINKFGISKALPILLNLQKLKIIQFNNNQQISFLSKNSLKNSVLETADAQSVQNFSILSKSLNLLPIHDDEENNAGDNDNNNDGDDCMLKKYSDADFGYPGYVPIFTRLIQSIYDRSFLDQDDSVLGSKSKLHQHSQRAIKYGWNNLDLTSLTGDMKQEFLVPDSKKHLFTSIIPPKISQLNKKGSSEHISTIIICAIGGLTWSEIATIKYVLNSNEYTKNKKLIILTTGMISSTQFIDSLTNI